MNAGGFPSQNRLKPEVITSVRRIRFLGVAALLLVWVLLICGKLVWLQVIRHHDYVERAARQQQRTFEVAPRRGVLYDRNLNELAMTVLVDSVYAVPSEITDKDNAAAALARIVHVDPADGFTSAAQIAARLNASRNFAWVARKLDAPTVDQVKALNLKGIYYQKEFKRFYPNNQISAQVLGYVGTDDNGLGGLERQFDEELHGTQGRMLTALDAKRHVLGSEEHEPLPGQNLVLTIDENIQFMAERALDAAMERTKPLNGTVVVQDPHTGQILALAIRPAYDPNDFRHANKDLLRNHAVSDVYEPGSTFKLVTYSAALEEKVARPGDIVDCQNGKITIFGRTIHDSHAGLGRVTVEKALWESSDVAAVKLAMKMGNEKFYQYIRSFGFGARSGIELPAETRGLVRPTRRWGATSIGSLAMGQEVGVTPIQLVTMVSTIANGGTYLPPHIVLASTPSMKGSPNLKPMAFHPGDTVPEPLPEGAHRVISTMTAAQMRKMMEGIVLYGTGKAASLNGYSSAGKTGTAQKIDVVTHTYSHTKYVASFAGFAPVNNPVISVTVIIDSPSAGGSYYGAAVSAPVFRDVAQQVLEYLGVPHDTELRSQPPTLPEKDLADAPPDHTGDLTALFAEVNDLPADDPLRTPAEPKQQAVADASAPSSVRSQAAASSSAKAASTAKNAPPEKIVPPPAAPATTLAKAEQLFKAATTAPPPGKGAVVVDSGKKVSVPTFVGLAMRKVVEQAGAAGLGVQIIGNGIAREQAPAPGTMVPVGTLVVIRCGR
ncbi:MAG TPA: penicillin-binding transpeptidase domain-containing protein [Acidisarcina sp.]|nr:penicillin-binding transpeptidase domain-containing protein [Acidisarcina sp.]